MINLPNLLTFIRILLVPVFILLFLAPGPLRSFLSAVVFLAASLTDLLDGYLARRWEQVTKLGKLLDPIADKLLVLSALVLLVQFHRVPGWIAIVLIGRELGMTGLRAIASTDGIVIPAEKTGKYKFVLQIIALVLLILDLRSEYMNFNLLGMILLWAAMVLSIVSAVRISVYYSTQMQMRKAG